METPCQQICTINNGVCTGCKRTMEEIRQLQYMTAEQRKEIMEEIKDRDE